MAPEDLQQASREELIERVVTTHARLEAAEQQLRWFKQQIFGARSERRVPGLPDPAQLSLGEGVAQATPEAPAHETTVRAHARRQRPRDAEADEPGLRFDDSVPVRTIVVPNPELEDAASDDTLVVQEKVTHRLAQRPAAYEVLRIVRHVVKRRSTGEISCPPAPPSVLPGSYADVSLLAGILIDKFRYHLPLYRQHQRMKAAGIEVSRTSLTNWVHRTIDLLDPVYHAQLASIVKSDVLAMDETPIRAGRKAKGQMRTAYFWPIYGDRDEVAFPYAASRSMRHAEEILGEFCGTLLTDGYAAYGRYAEHREKVVHALCWAHTRRGFVQAEAVEPARTARALERIRALYAVEDEIRELSGEAKLGQRAERSKPIVAAFFDEIETELVRSALLPTNPFTKAAHYALERRRGLEVFLEDPDVPIDTNHLERALRPIPMGRKNWLFCWTEVGAEKVGQIQSLIATCVLQGVDPYTYLVDVLQRIDTHPQARVAELTPRLWKDRFADAPMRSILELPLDRMGGESVVG